MDRNPTEKPGEPTGVLPAKWDGYAAFTVNNGAEILDISPAHLYAKIDKGEIGAIRIGRCIRIPRPVMIRLLTAA